MNALAIFESVDGAEQPRLALEPGATIRVRGERVRQDLDRDVARKLAVMCAIDLAHPARAEQRPDLVRAETFADQPPGHPGRTHRRRDLNRRRRHERLCVVRVRQERFDFASQLLVAGTGFAHERRALAFVARERGVIQLLDVAPAVGISHARSPEREAGILLPMPASRRSLLPLQT